MCASSAAIGIYVIGACSTAPKSEKPIHVLFHTLTGIKIAFLMENWVQLPGMVWRGPKCGRKALLKCLQYAFDLFFLKIYIPTLQKS